MAWPWRRPRGWPTSPPPTVPPDGPPRFQCAHCAHPTDLHPRPDQTDLTACAQCVAEEDLGERDEAEMCRLRYPRP